MFKSEELANVVLNKTWEMYISSIHFHWNTVGITFPFLHDFFGEIYNEVGGTIDSFAENIRKIYGIPLLQPVTHTIEIDPIKQLQILLNLNEEIITLLNQLYHSLEDESLYGFSNYVQDRLDVHSKHKWMISSTLK